MFSNEQIERYSRQILLKEIGATGTAKLLNSRVGIVGAGGLGCPAIQILASVGVGNIRIIDGDIVELSNLSRQMLHYTNDIGKFKVLSAKEKVEKMNPDVSVEIFKEFVNKENVHSFLSGCDYIIEGSDNLGTKFLINDSCIHYNIPFTIAGAVQFYGQVLSVLPRKTVCYRCLFHTPLNVQKEATCSAMGVSGTVPTVAAVLQANECIKYLSGNKPNFINKLFSFDLFHGAFDTIELKNEPDCEVCLSHGEIPFYKKEKYYDLEDKSCNSIN